jgi:hypothetical protein
MKKTLMLLIASLVIFFLASSQSVQAQFTLKADFQTNSLNLGQGVIGGQTIDIPVFVNGAVQGAHVDMQVLFNLETSGSGTTVYQYAHTQRISQVSPIFGINTGIGATTVPFLTPDNSGLENGTYCLKIRVRYYLTPALNSSPDFAETLLNGVSVEKTNYQNNPTGTYAIHTIPGELCFIMGQTNGPCHVGFLKLKDNGLGNIGGTVDVTAVPIGGSGSFTYLWNTRATTQTVTVLCGCEDLSVEITDVVTACKYTISKQVCSDLNCGIQGGPPVGCLFCRNGQSSPEAGISLYPNPAQDHINVSLSQETEQAIVSFYSLTGQVMLEQNLSTDSENRIDIGHLRAGLYIIQVKDGDSLLHQQKLMVK